MYKIIVVFLLDVFKNVTIHILHRCSLIFKDEMQLAICFYAVRIDKLKDYKNLSQALLHQSYTLPDKPNYNLTKKLSTEVIANKCK